MGSDDTLSIKEKNGQIIASYKYKKTGKFWNSYSRKVLAAGTLNDFISRCQLERLRYPNIYHLSDADRRAITLTGDFSGMNFSDMDLSGVSFSNANLTGANFHNADLSKSCFLTCKLNKVNFSDVRVAGAIFNDVTFDDAKLSNTAFSKSHVLIDVTLPDAQFAVTPRFSDLIGLDLTGVHFTTRPIFLQEELSAYVDSYRIYKTIDGLEDSYLKITLMENLVSSAANRPQPVNWGRIPSDILFKPEYLARPVISDFIDTKLIPELITLASIRPWMSSKVNVIPLDALLKRYSTLDPAEFSRLVVTENPFFVQLIHQCRNSDSGNEELKNRADELYQRYAAIEPVARYHQDGHYVFLKTVTAKGEEAGSDNVLVVSETELDGMIKGTLDDWSQLKSFNSVAGARKDIQAGAADDFFRQHFPLFLDDYLLSKLKKSIEANYAPGDLLYGLKNPRMIYLNEIRNTSYTN